MNLKQISIYGLVAGLVVAFAQPLSLPLSTEAEEQPRYVLPSGPPSRDGIPPPPPGYVYWKTVQALVTAYDPTERCCAGTADGKTSIMDNAWIMDGVAADPTAIPYRTRVWVPGAGWREVDDTGSAMRRSWRKRGRYHLDLRVPYFDQAKRWGAPNLKVHLYRPEPLLAARR